MDTTKVSWFMPITAINVAYFLKAQAQEAKKKGELGCLTQK